MELRNGKINIIELASMESAFRDSVKDGISAVCFTPMGTIEAYSLKDMLIDTTPKIEHTCNGERYLNNCKACKINSWRFILLSENNFELLISLEKSNNA